MTSPIDYAAVLADLEARREQIDAGIAAIRAIMGGNTPDAPDDQQAGADTAAGGTPATAPVTKLRGAKASTPRTPANGNPPTLQSDTFFGMNTSGAIKKFLSMAKRPQTPRTIADALVAGGQVHAVDPEVAYRNVYSVLRRAEDTEFSKTRNGEWGLLDWYRQKSTEGE